MQSITFTCETITPMFLAGADGTTPELRPPSIKGALRFWWRAMNGHLSLEDMKKAEGEIFGDTSQRSKVIIIVSEQPKQENIEPAALLPHKTHSSKPDSIKAKTTFNIELRLVKLVQLSNEKNFALKDLENLFIIAITLGGWGKRSRRGFGSVKIIATQLKGADSIPYVMPTSLEAIQKLLGDRFVKKDSMISVKNENGCSNYPYIKTIEFGATDSDITKKIINDSHLVKEKEYDSARYEARVKLNKCGLVKIDKAGLPIPDSNFEKAIGDGAIRFASPIYVSTIQTDKEFQSIITTLNAVPNGHYKESTHGVLQTEYKNNLKNIKTLDNGR